MTGVDLEVRERESSTGDFDAQRTLDALGAEFPTLMIDVYEPLRVAPRFAPVVRPEGDAPWDGERRLVIDATDLTAGSLAPTELDERVRGMAARGPFTLALLTATADVAASEGIVTRYQRFIARRNVHSRSPVFERILSKHRRLFAQDDTRILLDYEHARDVWHWVLRLDREATLPLQLAALFHEVACLTRGSDRTIERETVDYRAFKEGLARESALMALEILEGLGLEEDVLARTVHLIEKQEQRCDGHEEQLLADADVLSFLAQAYPGFVDEHGKGHAVRKVGHELSRLRAGSRAWIDRLWLSAEMRTLIAEALAQPPQP